VKNALLNMVLTPKGYKPRLIDEQISQMLKVMGAIYIEGPKWCGKTWTAENHSNSEYKMTEREGPVSNKQLAEMDPRRALKGEIPHLIDEWNDVPAVWDLVRNEVDKDNTKGKFILTGSSVPRRNEYDHSGTGRIGPVQMRTMSLYETGDSDGRISLKGLFDKGQDMTECGDVVLEDLIALTVRGGWPAVSDLKGTDTSYVPKTYLKFAIDDASTLDGKKRNREKMKMLVRSLARNESTTVSNATLMRDMKVSDEENIAQETFADYMDCLDRIHLLDDVPNFRPNIRSEMRIGKAPKRHLADPSLAIAALKLTPKMLENDLKTFGFMFEALCEHDLRIYAESLGWNMYHYRDYNDREIDAVVETDDGRWGAFEIKLGPGQVDEAAKNLLKIKDLFEKEGHPPSILCVICGLTSFAYTRPDGVMVVPVTSLGP
jgi:predicted AAA+ superfamily ATPase